jgi:DNA-directed RNA polymerase subunit RPC12/RpoP
MTIRLCQIAVSVCVIVAIGFLSAMIILILPLPHIAGLYAQEAEIYIEDASVDKTNGRSAVYFPHERHMELLDCLDCHHDYQKGENVLEEEDLEEDGLSRCTNCHTNKASIELKKAYHRQCMNCHRTINKNEERNLPITCKDCHPIH